MPATYCFSGWAVKRATKRTPSFEFLLHGPHDSDGIAGFWAVLGITKIQTILIGCEQATEIQQSG
jgi:hypothetical protein